MAAKEGEFSSQGEDSIADIEDVPVPRSPEAPDEDADVRVLLANMAERHDTEIKILRNKVSDLKQKIFENVSEAK